MMTLSEVLQLRKEKPREFDALVAERVMGWKLEKVLPSGTQYWRDDGGRGYKIGAAYYDESNFEPDESAADDYSVLCHIREKWDGEQQSEFRWILEEVLTTSSGVYSSPINYRPGDYAAAALAAVGKAKR